MVKIGITNAVVSNTGDAAILEGIVEAIRAVRGIEREEFVIFDSAGDRVSTLYPEFVVRQQFSISNGKSRLGRAVGRKARALISLVLSAIGPQASTWLVRRFPLGPLRALSDMTNCDVIVSSGGTYLVDAYNFGSRVVELRAASALGKRVVLWTQSMGPFRSQRARKNIETLGPYVDAVFARDDRSAAAWNSVKSRRCDATIAADAAFALSRETVDGQTSSPSGGSAILAISVRNWDMGIEGGRLDLSPYTTALRRLAASAIESGADVVAISTCQGSPWYGNDDSVVARRIFDGLPVRVDGDHHSPSDLLRLMGGFDLVVATRMHFSILCLIAQIPVISVAYEFKSIELFESIGLGDAVASMEDLSSDWLLERYARAKDDPRGFTLSGGQLAALRESALLPARHLFGSGDSVGEG